MTAIESGFELDLRRSITLGLYIKHWGIPHQRHTFNPARLGGQTVEVYDFQRAEPREVRRVATVGLAAAGSDKRSWELMFALPQDLAEASWEDVASFLLDVGVYSIATHPCATPGAVTDPSPLAPSAWGERGVLIAHAISEDEELAAGWHVGTQHVDLHWIVPVLRSEVAAIRAHGLAWFYDAMERSEWSAVDPIREAFV